MSSNFWFFSRQQHQAIDAYWDAVVERSPAEPIRPETVDAASAGTILQLHALAPQPAPSPEFAARLLTELTAAIPAVGQATPAPSQTEMNGETTMTSATFPAPALPKWRPELPKSRTSRRWVLAQLAAAALLIIALIGGYVWFEGRNEQPAVVVPSTPEPTPGDDKNQYRYGPNRSGVSPSDGPTGQPIELWSAQTQGPITAEPAVVDGVVYLGSGDGNLYAFDAVNGEERWRFEVGIGPGSSPAVEDGIAYFANQEGMLFAVDAATGEERWSFPAGRDNSSPAIAGGVVYSGSLDGNLYALDAQTGNELWHAPLGASASRAASVAGDLVYIGSDNGLLHAFDLATGEERWQIDTAGTIVGTPMIVDGVLYHGAGSDDNLQRIARDAATGDELWRWGIEGGGPTSIASVSEDRIYVGGSDGNIYALDAATGTEEWRFSAGSPAGSTVTLAGGVVYATTEDGNLYGVDAETGLEVFRFSIGGRQNYGPAILDGVAYVGNHLGVLYAIGGSEELLIQAPAAAASPEASPEAGAVISAEFLWETGENLTIQSYDADGHPGVSWGGRGTGDGQFLEASDIAIDPAGNLHVVDVQRGDVQKFSPNGEYLLTVGGPATPLGPGVGVDGDGNIYAPAVPKSTSSPRTGICS